MTDAEHEGRPVDIADPDARRAAMTARYGNPEPVGMAEALALARASGVPVDPAVTPDDIWADIARDDEAAEAWLETNLVHHGHPALAKVPLPDGRVIGILDLRPALERARGQEQS